MAAHYATYQTEDGFVVRHHTKVEGGRKVYWSPREGIISCSCHHFEFSGILCRHALRVLSTGNCFQLPEQYLPMRWRRVSSFPSGGNRHATGNDHRERVELLQSMLSSLVAESAKSKQRMDLVIDQIAALLSQIREQPLLTQTPHQP